MSNSRVVWQKIYHGFEDFSDYWRDTHEAVDSDFNPEMKKIPGEFQGKVKVTIEYIPEDKDERPEGSAAS